MSKDFLGVLMSRRITASDTYTLKERVKHANVIYTLLVGIDSATRPKTLTLINWMTLSSKKPQRCLCTRSRTSQPSAKALKLRSESNAHFQPHPD